MTSIGKLLMCGAVAAMAIAISSAPSEAAKRRAAASCMGPGGCSHSCKGGTCQLNACGFDGKWHQAVLPPACVTPFCPKKC